MRFLSFLALPVLVLTTALPAFASSTHRVYNLSDTCAWVTIDRAGYADNWSNAASGYIKPGQNHMFTIGNVVHIKVRTETTEHPDCSGRKTDDISITEIASFGHTLGNSEATLRRRDYGGGFLLVWGR